MGSYFPPGRQLLRDSAIEGEARPISLQYLKGCMQCVDELNSFPQSVCCRVWQQVWYFPSISILILSKFIEMAWYFITSLSHLSAHSAAILTLFSGTSISTFSASSIMSIQVDSIPWGSFWEKLDAEQSLIQSVSPVDFRGNPWMEIYLINSIFSFFVKT